MKIADISDLHLSGGNIEVIQPALETALKRMKREGVSFLFINGDIFHHYNISSRFHSVATVWHAFTDTIKRSGIKTIVIPGQHDQSGPGEKHALVACEGFVEVVDQIEIRIYQYRKEEIMVLFIPWQYPYQFLTPKEMECATSKEIKNLFRKKVEAKIGEYKEDILAFKKAKRGKVKICGHLQVIAAEIGENFLNTEGEFPFHHWFLEDVGADYIHLGDFHRRQKIGKCQYIGHFIQNNFGDEGNPVGFLLTDVTRGEEKFIEVPAPKYFTLNNDQYYDNYKKIEKEGLANYYRIKDFHPPNLPLLPNVTYKRLPAPSEEAPLEFTSSVNEETLLKTFERWASETCTKYDEDVIEKFMALDICKDIEETKAGSFQELTFIRIKHFGLYDDVEVNFRGKNYVSIYGDNGVGKTILMESIIAVFYSFFPTYPGQYYNRITRGFGGEAEISVGFISHNQEWVAQRKVVRSQRDYGIKDSQWTCLYKVKNGQMIACPETITKGKVKEFEQVIKELVGSSDVILGSVFNSQKRKGDLGEQEDKDREAFFQDLFNVNRFNIVLPRLSEEISKNEEIMERCKTTTEVLEKQRGTEQILEEDISFIENELREIEERYDVANKEVEEYRERLRDLEEKARDSNNKYSTLSKNNKRILQNQSEIERLKVIIKEYSSERKNAEEYNKKVETILGEIKQKPIISKALREENERLTHKKVLQVEIAALKKESEKINESGCKGSFDCIFLSEAKKAIEKVKEKENEVKEFEKVEDNISKIKENIGAIEKKELSLNQIRVGLARSEERLKQIPILVGQIKQKRKENGDLKAENDAMVIMPHKEINAEKKTVEVEMQLAIGQRKIINDERRLKTSELAVKREWYDNFNRIEQELTEIGKTYIEAERYKKNLKILSRAFGQSGIPRLLMQESIPQIQQIIDNIMEGIDSRFLIKIRNVNTNLKTMKEKDGIFIRLEDFNGEANLLEFSPGQQDFAKTIIRLAVAIYKTQKAGGSYNVFIGDEMFTSLTRENALAMVSVIKNATKFFNQVILIDHLDLVVDQFPFKMEVRLEGRNVKVFEA